MGAPAKNDHDDAIEKIIVNNRRATFDYAIEDSSKAGSCSSAAR